MRISVSKKIMLMVLVPIVAICVIVSMVATNILDSTITSEIEKQLAVSAYNFKTEYGMASNEELAVLLSEFKRDNGVDVTIFEDNKRTLSTIDGAVGTDMDNEIYNCILRGDDYFATDANVNGQAYFGYYIPIMEDDKYIGASFTGIPQEDANKVIVQSVIKIIGWIVICGVISAVIAFFRVRKMVRGIKNLESTMVTLAANNLAVAYEKLPVEHDEIDELYNKTISFSEHLRNIIKGIKHTSTDLKSLASDLKDATEITSENSSKIASAVNDVSQGAENQAHKLEDTVIRMDEMKCELSNISDNVNELHGITDSMNQAKNNVVSTLAELQKVNTAMSNVVENTSNQVKITSKSVQKIKAAVEMIEKVADETKLLSLNASIEASKAGEHGRGFAVVAENIRELSAQSATSSSEIKTILEDLEENYQAIIENVYKVSDNMGVQNEKLSDTQNTFNILEEDINKTVERTVNINVMVSSLNSGINDIADVITDLSAISEENTACAQESTSSVTQLDNAITEIYESVQMVDGSADSLTREVNQFKTE